MLRRVILSFILVAFAAGSVPADRHSSSETTIRLVHGHHTHEHSLLHKRQNASTSALTEAQQIVEAAVKQQGE
jgi:hypothetical protein